MPGWRGKSRSPTRGLVAPEPCGVRAGTLDESRREVPMPSDERSLEVAAVQASGPLFDSRKGVEKACRLIADAAASGARLILLPEAFIGGYPRGLSFGTVVGSRSGAGRDLFARY